MAQNQNTRRSINITVVGGGDVGKRCILTMYTTKINSIYYVPHVFDSCEKDITVDEKDFTIRLNNTSGQDNYPNLRPFSYLSADCFILCYSISSRQSFNNILSKWHPELSRVSPKVPIILVGTKNDLRESNESDLITIEEGKIMKEKIKAAAFLECSAKKRNGLEEVFIEAVRAVTIKKNPRPNIFSTLFKREGIFG